MIHRAKGSWLLMGLGFVVGIGLVGGLAWAMRPRAEAETAALARRELREAIHQLDLFLQAYASAPEAARGALQRARAAFEKAAGHLALTDPAEAGRLREKFQRLQELADAASPPGEVLPSAQELRDALARWRPAGPEREAPFP